MISDQSSQTYGVKILERNKMHWSEPGSLDIVYRGRDRDRDTDRAEARAGDGDGDRDRYINSRCCRSLTGLRRWKVDFRAFRGKDLRSQHPGAPHSLCNFSLRHWHIFKLTRHSPTGGNQATTQQKASQTKRVLGDFNSSQGARKTKLGVQGPPK